MKEYAIYPMKSLKISQRHDEGNHVPHWKNSKNYSDKPWDEAGKDSGQDVFSPMNDFKIIKILGLNSSTTNTIILQSVNKLYMPYKEEADYLFLTLTHINENDLKNLKVGQIIKKGEQNQFIREGTDGYATGNHFHITVNLGKYYGLLQNSNGSWVFTYEKSLLPNEAFYIDTSHTIIYNAKNYQFRNVPIDYFGTPLLRNELVNQVEVLASNVRARKSANGEILGYMNKGVYDILEEKSDENYKWLRVEDNLWFAYSSSWSTLYPTKQTETPQIPTIDEDSTNTLPSEENSNTSQKNKFSEVIKKIVENISNILHKIFKKK